MNDLIGTVRQVERNLVAEAVARASALRGSAINFAMLIGGAVFVVLVLSLVFTVLVGRSMVRPLRRLRAGALEVAGIRLPETVRRMSESDADSIGIDVESTAGPADEIGEVARAFDRASRGAQARGERAALRGRQRDVREPVPRSQPSERQIRLIDSRSAATGPDRWPLFQMDHPPPGAPQLREPAVPPFTSRRGGGTSPSARRRAQRRLEIEQYERVVLNVQPGIAVRSRGQRRRAPDR
jgi:hypothetical protein